MIMKKRFLSIGLTAVMLGTALPCLPVMNAAVYAEDYDYAEEDEIKTYGQLQYHVANGEFVVIKTCDKYAEEIVIPEEIDGLPVKIIGSSAFSKCTSLVSVMIPSSVTIISRRAFAECCALSSVTIPDSVTSIEYETFSWCTSLASVTIPDSVTSIGAYAFDHCYALTAVTIPDSVTKIGFRAFVNCIALTSVTIPDSVTSIDDFAFNGCNKLTEINVSAENSKYASPDGVLFDKQAKQLIQYPIGNTRKSYTIPDGTESISPNAFSGCKALNAVTLPDSMTDIGFSAFYNCAFLNAVTFPRDLQSIGYDAFSCCHNVTFSGYAGSYAETYANDFNIPFKVIEKTESKPLLGDLNSDNLVTVSDAIMLARIVAEDKSLKTTKEMIAAADYNKDGSITADDTTALLKALAGIK